MLREPAGRLQPEILSRAIGWHRPHVPKDDVVGVADSSSGDGILPELKIKGCDLVAALCRLAGEVLRREAVLRRRRAAPSSCSIIASVAAISLGESFEVSASLGDFSTTAMATQRPVQVGGGAPGSTSRRACS